jgi:hypothetical protein
MGVLKGLALSLFGFLLFLSLIILGPGYTLNSTVLNPAFIGSEIDRIQVSSIVSEVLSEQVEEEEAFPPELETAIIKTIHEIEPVVKEQLKSVIQSVGDYLRGKKDDPELRQVMGNTFLNGEFVGDVLAKVDLADIAETSLVEALPEEFAGALVDTISEQEAELKTRIAAAVDPVFDYLLEETDSVDLATILRGTVMSTDFITTLLDELDISYLSSEFLLDNINDYIPEDVDIPTNRLEEAVAALGPSIAEAMNANVDTVLDYLLGQAQTLDITVSLGPVMDDIEDILRDTLLDYLPAEVKLLPQAERDQRLDEYLSEVMGAIPSNFELDETMFGSEIPEQITAALADAEDALAELRGDIAEVVVSVEESLEEPRQYIGYFLSAYMGLLALIGVCVLAIIALHHRVKGACLQLGITALVCGAIEFAAIILGKNFAVAKVAEVDMPQAVRDLPDLLINDFAAPLQTLSLGLLGVGLVLIVVSIVYPRLRGKSSETEG